MQTYYEGIPTILYSLYVCQVTKALLEGDRLLLNRQSRWHAGLDVTLPRTNMPTSKHRLCQILAAVYVIISILFVVSDSDVVFC